MKPLFDFKLGSRVCIGTAISIACLISFELSWANSPTGRFMAPCGVDFSTLRPFSDEMRKSVEAFVSKVRESVRLSFQRASSRQFVDNTSPSLKGLRMGEIEAIPIELLPTSKRNLEIAEFVNNVFQREDDIVEMSADFAKQVAEARIRFKPDSFEADRLISANRDRIGQAVVQRVAREQGWGEIVDLDDLCTPEEFRTKLLSKGALFLDSLHRGDAHSQYSHLLQWLMLTPKLDQKFGPGTTREFMKFLGSEEGFPLWAFIFDRPRGYYRDLRGPVSFSEFRLTGSNSWLGLD